MAAYCQEVRKLEDKFDICWYLLTQIEYEGLYKRTKYHCSILLEVFQVSLFIFYHKKTME
jgi:hypothetical protein